MAQRFGAAQSVVNDLATGPKPATTTASMSAPGQFPSVTLRYIESSAIRVRGPVTGRPYDFSVSQPFQAVDVRDAAVFTRNPSFRRSAPPDVPHASPIHGAQEPHLGVSVRQLRSCEAKPGGS